MMTTPLVECIPNFSEGRRPQVINAIEASIGAVQGVHVLDLHSDEDHNRSVITFAGPPEAVEQAAFAAIAKAAELIDLDRHEGEHPRIGATDVVPFVPLRGISMEACVEMARRLGQRVGEELGIPVYLYEKAATRPDRVNLENIRKGEYETLKTSIESDPDRKPDFGPSKLGKAGATVIGARAPLIAYNVYLATDDVAIAKKIARAVRHSSGGFRAVKALGLSVEGFAQVSMNLTDYKLSPLARVVETIRREAARYGVNLHHSELVGLIPQEAIVAAAQWYLQLDQFEHDQILETRLYAAQGESQGAGDGFLEMLASGTPTPGGGSAAAYAGAMAAALVAMVARLTVDKKKFVEVRDRMQAILSHAEGLRASFLSAVQQDAAAFDEVMAAYRMSKETPKEKAARKEAIERAMTHAAAVPLQVAGQALETLSLAAEVAQKGNRNAVTDAGSAGAMAAAALHAAAMNVRINAASVDDRQAAQAWIDELASIEQAAAEAHAHLDAVLRESGAL